MISVLQYLRRPHTQGPFSGKPTGASNGADFIVSQNRIDLATKVLAVGLKQPLRFGVEVEHQGLSFAQVAQIVSRVVRGRAASDDGPTAIHTADGRVWHTVADGGGVEVISPILQGPEDLAILQQIVAALRDAGGVTDQRAGLHVHIDGKPFQAQEVLNLANLMARHESWLYPVWGVHANRRLEFCRPIGRQVARICAQMRCRSPADLACIWGASRYTGLNLQNYLHGFAPKHTVEFRYLNGTLDPTTLGCAVGLYMAVAKQALSAPGRPAEAPKAVASLPVLLKELGMARDHPVAVHLRSLFGQRVLEGWAHISDVPKPDIASLLEDDDLLHGVCCMLSAGASAKSVARAVSILMETPKSRWAARTARAREFAALVDDAADIEIETSDAFDLLAKENIRDAAALVSCVCQAKTFQSADAFMKAARLMAPLLKARAKDLARVSEIVPILVGRNAQAGLETLHTLVDMPASELTSLHEVARSLNPWVVRNLSTELLHCQAQGNDVRKVAAHLQTLGVLTEHHPEAAMRFVLEHPKGEFVGLAPYLEELTKLSWSGSELFDAAACLMSWVKRPGADIACLINLLSLMVRADTPEKSELLRALSELPISELNRLQQILATLSMSTAKSVAHAALGWLKQGRDVERLCASVQRLGFFSPRMGDDIRSFVSTHTDAQIERMGTAISTLLLSGPDEHRFLALVQQGKHCKDWVHLAKRLQIISFVADRPQQTELLALYERYPKMSIAFLRDGIGALQSGKATIVPGNMTTQDEGKLLRIMSRACWPRGAQLSELFERVRLPSWRGVRQADQTLLNRIKAGAPWQDIVRLLRAHPNLHGLWGADALMHLAPESASTRGADGRKILIRLYEHLAAQGVDLNVGNKHGETPTQMAGRYYFGTDLQKIRKSARAGAGAMHDPTR